MSIKQTLLASAILAAKLVASHSVITNAVGDAGGSGMALGVVSSTPRDGTRRRPFQQDATRFRGASADTFGETVGAGDNKLEQGTQSIMAETGDSLPQVTPGGQLQMTLHQVNSDGAGPYTCMINADGTGGDWTNIQVTQNVDGNQRGRNRDGQAADHPLTAAIPQNQQCSGNVAGQDNVCLVRCQNPAAAGPFGGVIPVQMAGANNGTNTGNANAGNTGNAGSNTGTNTGNGNTGNGNTGNAGNNNNNGNTGNANAGTGNNNGNTGSNTGNGNTGTGNAGSNTGNGNTGNGNAGNGNTGTGTNNGNTGSNTGGLGPNITPIANQGSGNANTGNANTGSNTNTGSNNGNNGNINRRAKTEEALEDIEEIGDEHEDRRRAIKFIA